MGTTPVLTKEEEVWVIRVDNPSNGKTQEYRCATEKQARQLMTALQPKDSSRK